MRIGAVERGEGLKTKVMFGVIRVLSGFRAPDVVRTLWFRPRFFGAPHTVHTQAVMRGQSAWSVADRELFAAWVSRINECRF